MKNVGRGRGMVEVAAKMMVAVGVDSVSDKSFFFENNYNLL